MSVYLECDKCQKRLKIPENVIGQTIKCPTCGAVFKATSDKIQADKPSSRPPAVVAPDDDDDLPRPKKKAAVLDEDDDDRVTAKKKPAVLDDDEDDEPRPKRKAAVVDEDDDEPRPAKRRRVEDEDEHEEKPRKRRVPWYVLLPLLILSLSGVGIAFLWAIGFTWLRGQSWWTFDLVAEKDISFDTKTMIGIAAGGAITLLCLIFALIPIRSWLRFVLVLFFLILGYGGSIAAVHWWKELPFSMNERGTAPVVTWSLTEQE